MPMKTPGAPIFHRISQQTINSYKYTVKTLQCNVKLSLDEQPQFKLFLVDNMILLACRHTNQLLASVQMSFDLKFEKIFLETKEEESAVAGLRLINEFGFAVSIYIQFPQLTLLWCKVLSKHISQYGFHRIFKPIKRLGKGASATVYSVMRVQDGKTFATKAFSKQFIKSSPFKKNSLINELTILRNTHHSNVLQLEGVYESDNSIYVVFDQLTGGNLNELLNQKKAMLNLEEVKQVMRGLLEGLHYLHELDIMHRDIKLENIMMKDKHSLMPVIVDFGLSACTNDEDYIFYRCGTPGYVAPEVLASKKGQKTETVCDIFSSGVIFHILLTNRYLFNGKNVDQIYENNKKLAFDLCNEMYSFVNGEAMDLLKKMLAINPKDRISAKECLNHSFLREEMAQVENEKEEVSPASTNEDDEVNYYF